MRPSPAQSNPGCPCAATGGGWAAPRPRSRRRAAQGAGGWLRPAATSIAAPPGRPTCGPSPASLSDQVELEASVGRELRARVDLPPQALRRGHERRRRAFHHRPRRGPPGQVLQGRLSEPSQDVPREPSFPNCLCPLAQRLLVRRVRGVGLPIRIAINHHQCEVHMFPLWPPLQGRMLPPPFFSGLATSYSRPP